MLPVAARRPTTCDPTEWRESSHHEGSGRRCSVRAPTVPPPSLDRDSPFYLVDDKMVLIHGQHDNCSGNIRVMSRTGPQCDFGRGKRYLYSPMSRSARLLRASLAANAPLLLLCL